MSIPVRKLSVRAARSVLWGMSLWLCAALSHAAGNAALLVGISQYQEISSGVHYADNDALRFSQKLAESREFQSGGVVKLLNSEATKHNINEQLRSIIASSKTNQLDKFIFYFAGHGVERSEKSDAFLLPYDASRRDSYISSNNEENDTFINRGWLAKRLADINAREIVVIIDACYSGTEDFGNLFVRNLLAASMVRLPAKPGSMALPIGERGIKRNDVGVYALADSDLHRFNFGDRVFVFIASSGENETSKELELLRCGVLTCAMIESLDNLQKTQYRNNLQVIKIADAYEGIRHVFDVKGFFSFQNPMVFPLPSYQAMQSTDFLILPGTKPVKSANVQYQVMSGGVKLAIYNQGVLLASAVNPIFSVPADIEAIDAVIDERHFRRTIRLQPGNPVISDIVFRGRLDVDGSLVDASGNELGKAELDIALDGKPLGRSSLSLENIVVGSHMLTLVANGKKMERDIEIRSDSPLRVRVRVAKGEGSKANGHPEAFGAGI